MRDMRDENEKLVLGWPAFIFYFVAWLSLRF
jgi:hypothetical protein